MAVAASLMVEIGANVARLRQDMRHATSIMRSSASEMSSAFSGVKNVLQGVVAVMAGQQMTHFAKGFLDTAASMEKTKILLTNLTGSAEQAKTSMDWIFEQGSKAFGIEATKDAFVKLKAVGIDPTKDSLVPLMDALSAFGRTSKESLDRTTAAISQMAGKGVVQMEELRQQLGEAIPTAIPIMARELGISVQELFERTSKGALSAKEGLSALFSGLGKTYGGMTAEMGNTWDGLMNQMSAQWTMFKNEVMESEGLFAILKAGAREFLDELLVLKQDGSLKAWAADMARAVVEAFRHMSNAALTFMAIVNKVRQAWNSALTMVREKQLGDINAEIGKIENPAKGIEVFGYEIPGTEKMKSDVKKWLSPFYSGDVFTARVEEVNTAALEKLKENRKTIIDELTSAKEATVDLMDQENGLKSTFDGLNTSIDKISSSSGAAAVSVKGMGMAFDVAGGGAGKGGKGGGGGGGRSKVADMHEWNAAMREAQSIIESNFTATQKYNVELDKLNWFRDAGLLSMEQYNSALEGLNEEYEKNSQREWVDQNKELYEAMNEGKQVFDQTRTEAEKYAIELERLNYLLGQNAIDQDTYNRAVKKASGTFSEIEGYAKKFTDSLESTIGDTLYNVFMGKFDDIGKGFQEMLARMAADFISSELMKLLKSGLGSLMGGLGGGGGGCAGGVCGIGGGDWSGGLGLIDDFFGLFMHQGGIIGNGGSRRPVSPFAFIGAPRLHGGLAADEFPAILQAGETVIPRGGRSSGDIEVTNIVNVNSAGMGGMGQQDPEQAKKFGTEISRIIDAKFKETLRREMRFGGVLNSGGLN